MASLQRARNLVCNFCWQNFFNTEQFQLLCLCRREGNYCDNRITCKMTVQQINGSASNGCNWCSYIRTFTSGGEETRDPDDVLSISLCDFYPDYSSPTGKNMYYLSMDWESPKRETRAGWSLRIHAFTNSTDLAAPFVTARELQTEVYSDASRHQIRNWLAECADHSQCPEQVETILPTRVIEVAPAISPDRPRLLATAGKKGRYAALSYCWGSNSYGELRRSRLNQYLEHLDLEVLPQTLRDAIAVAKSISVPYLWVDALCILQDSDEDKSFEISKMERVYRDSLVTIVAANSEGVTQGFLQPRKMPMESFNIPFRLSGSQFGTMSVQELDEMEYEESEEPINKRAWALQESMLAHRYLIYSSHTLQWRCNAGVRNHGNSLHLVHYADDEQISRSFYTLNKPASDPKGELRRWMRLVSVYSKRSSSLSRDKLNAISAVARGFSPLLGPEYFAGLWQFSILWQLTWVPTCSWDSEARNTRPEVYRAPSWSWASVDGPLDYESIFPGPDGEVYLYKCDFISCQIEPKSAANPFGEVLAGSLKLQGVLRQGWFNPSENHILWADEDNDIARAIDAFCLTESRQGSSKEAEDNESTDQDSRLKAFHDESGNWPSMQVFCLPIWTFEKTIRLGLLLVKAEKETFKRIGSFENAPRTNFDHLSQREITII
ncbi:heterokaryon incompatibility protein-domain-containing protein [Hyaloscypha finlandica]|nr:heterokaryon incompatibility protein-domain-containing protein [Hyaloscypha finlandica]